MLYLSNLALASGSIIALAMDFHSFVLKATNEIAGKCAVVSVMQ